MCNSVWAEDRIIIRIEIDVDSSLCKLWNHWSRLEPLVACFDHPSCPSVMVSFSRGYSRLEHGYRISITAQTHMSGTGSIWDGGSRARECVGQRRKGEWRSRGQSKRWFQNGAI